MRFWYVCIVLLFVFGCESAEDAPNPVQDRWDTCISTLFPKTSECVGFVKDDISACEHLTEEKYWCISEYHFTHGLDRCDAIPIPEMEHTCEAVVMSDVTVCDAIREAHKRAFCRAMATNNISSLENYRETDLLEEFIYLRALEQSDARLCEGIEEPERRTKCFAQVHDDANLCLTDEQVMGCMDHVTDIVDNASLCSNLHHEQLCRTMVQRKADHKAVLETMGDYDNQSHCDPIVNRSAKQACLSIVNRDLDQCLGVSSEKFREMCILMFIEFNDDPALCSVLDDGSTCRDYVRQFGGDV
ncbi:MAG: hypothetical protein ACQESG_00090 [Nanobdellota archaeon]